MKSIGGSGTTVASCPLQEWFKKEVGVAINKYGNESISALGSPLATRSRKGTAEVI